MKAIVVVEGGVACQEVSEPVPGDEDVLVRVHAAALNRADLTVAAGAAHGSIGGPGTIVGMEWAGEVQAVGANVQGITAGDRVMGAGAAGFADLVVTDYGRVVRIPDSLGFDQAATLPIALNTMHNAVVTRGRLEAGESILIQGASSGVGLMGLQIARHKGAGLIVGSSTHAGRRARLTDFGADLAVDTSDPDWPERVLEATDGKGVNLIVDQVSASVANANLKAAAVLGRIVNVGRLGGARGEFDFDLHALKRIEYIGVTFRTRSKAEIREIAALMQADLWPAVTSGELALPIDKRFALADAAEALAYMAANQHLGKVVLEL